MSDLDQELEKTENGLTKRVTSINKLHTKLYDAKPSIVVRSPGRAEIIGNHVDYNSGIVIAGAIQQSTLVTITPTTTETINIYSDQFSTNISSFNLEVITKDKYVLIDSPKWCNYVLSVLQTMNSNGIKFLGLNITITSTVPFSGGVSSSAALELGIAKAVSELFSQPTSNKQLADLCQIAEHNIGSNCGLLDQYAVALGEAESFLKLDFQDNSVETINVDLDGRSFLIVFDPNVKRELGETGYPERRKSCETGLQLLSEVSGLELTSLRDATMSQLRKYSESFIAKATETSHDGNRLLKRVTHIVSEISRTEQSITKLLENDLEGFGKLMTESGQSALDNYDLDDDTPELRYLFETLKQNPKVMGVRNMGGGFSAVVLALVDNSEIQSIEKYISELYMSEYNSELETIVFTPSAGTSLM